MKIYTYFAIILLIVLALIPLANAGVVNTITVGTNPRGVAFNPSGTLAYVNNQGSASVSVINPAANSVVNTITVGTDPYGVAFNPSGTLAYVTNQGSASVSVINPATNSVVNTITVGTDPFAVAFNLSGTLAYVTNGGSASVSVINPAANSVVNTITVGTDPFAVAFNPSGTLAYVTNMGSASVSVINPATNSVVNTITVGTDPYGVAFNPSGTLAYVTNGGSASVSVINPATNSVVNTITVGTIPRGVAFNPSGTLAYVTNQGSASVSVINPAANSVVNTITVGTIPTGVAFNPSGTLAYVTNVGSASVSVINPFTITLVSVSANPSAYETSTQTINYVINFAYPYTTANVEFQIYNSIGLTGTYWQNQTANTTGNNYFTFNYEIPLLSANNIIYSYNTFGYGYGTINTLTQTEYENYFPAASILHPSNPSNVLLGTNITVNTIINQVFNLNAVTASGYVQIGNKEISEVVTGPYTYWANVTSVNPLSYGLRNPTLGSPVNVIANSIVELTYNENSVFRNVTAINFQVYNESLTNCGSPYGTNAINWKFYNVSTLTLWPGNVLVSGYFVPSLNGYTGSTQTATNVGFALPATGNVYSTCIYPSWAKFNVSGTFQYSNGSSIVSTYQPVFLPVSNMIKTINLYLQTQLAPVDYDIYVLNQQNQVYIPALVYVYSYNINTNTSILINQLQIPSLGFAPVTLQAGDQYTFGIYSPNGKSYYGSQGPLTAAQCGSPPCGYTLYVNAYNNTYPSQTYGDISTSCTNSTTGTNQITVSCTYASRSGSTYTFYLQGYENGAILGVPICNQTVTAASGTLACPFNNVTDTQYFWQFSFNKNGTVALNNGYVGTSSNIFGPDAAWFAILVILTLGLLFLTKSITVSVMVFDVGFVAMNYIGLIFPQGFPLISGFLIIVSAVILYLVNRK